VKSKVMKDIFDAAVVAELVERINTLTPSTPAKWGKMNVAQMLAHCSVTYEMIFEDKHPKSSGFMKFMLKLFVKPTVVGDKPYKNNSRTAPAFVIADERIFETEKVRLIAFIQKVQGLGGAYFNNKESHSFGKLTTKEWNVMFYKHLDYHLSQFGA
jgi:hypothetical protein